MTLIEAVIEELKNTTLNKLIATELKEAKKNEQLLLKDIVAKHLYKR